MCRYRFTRYAFAIALTCVVATPAMGAASAAAPGGIGVRLVDVPSAGANDPRARLYIVDHLAPGAVIHRRIEISNTMGSTSRMSVYPAAATIANGSFLGSAGRTANDLSSWTSVAPSSPVLAAGARAMVDVTIKLPRDAAPGERYGVVWAEIRSAKPAGGVIRVERVGIRLYISVGAGAAAASNFTIDSLTASRTTAGVPVVLAAVHNTGGRALDMNGTLQLLSGPGGLRAGPFPAALGTTLAIGDRGTVGIALDKRLPAGPWDARITLRSGLLERRARATINFSDSGASSVVNTTPVGPGSLRGIIAGVLVLLGSAAVIGVIGWHGPKSRWRSRRFRIPRHA